MSRKNNTLVLTTREYDWWLSMQEIIRALEGIWAVIGQFDRDNVRMLRVPLAPEIEPSVYESASQLKRIVITAVTDETLKIALLLRRQINVTAPMIIYIHGDATVGLHAFRDLADILTERDMFVVFCDAEVVAIRCCFPKARVSVIPLPLVDQFKLNGGAQYKGRKTGSLAYVGRISEQKNLHTLLFALWILRTSYGHAPVTLSVYGGEDHWGSPNMGLKYSNYGTYLQTLSDRLGLADMVTWHGFKPRDWLFENIHIEPHIFVSPTVHSDENFGSSVLASLVNGNQVVTTAWGGHFGFREWFPQQLTLVPVHRSTMGPVMNPVLLAKAILQATDRTSTAAVEVKTLDRARVEFSKSTAVRRTFDMLSLPDVAPVPLEKSPNQRRVDEQRAHFGGMRKIYPDYADPIANTLFEAYGMKESLIFDARSRYVLTPWVSYSDRVLRIDDPHRGQQHFSLDQSISEPLDVMMCPSMNTCRLPESLVQTLVAQGYAFAIPPAHEGSLTKEGQ